MKELQPILKEIVGITTRIETEYPELYRFLDENPMTIPTANQPNIDYAVLTEYLENLKGLLQHHLETPKKH